MNGSETTSYPKGVKLMCSPEKTFQVNLDYWIYGADKSTKCESVSNLINILRFGQFEPDTTLLDVVRSLQKLEKLTHEEYEENNNLFPFQRRFAKELDIYDEEVSNLRDFHSENHSSSIAGIETFWKTNEH